MIDNYPDDIRSWDHDPRSPFYVEPPRYCTDCGNLIDEEDEECSCEESECEQPQ